ncbi:UNVERIFIED_CONTAM: HU family DNA-binding protein [Prevotella sp. 15_C9]
MAVKYRMYQDNRKKSKTKGLWFARAVMDGTVGVKELSERISDRCTVTEADILAVISALVKEMSYVLKSGKRVKLEGFGSFKVGIRSHGEGKNKDFTAAKNIYDPHILFRPETRVDAGKHRVKTFLTDLKLEQVKKYAGAGDETGEPGEPGTTGGTTGGNANP